MTAPAGDAVLVVIPCLNEEAMLPELLAQIAADRSATYIIVADGGSTDSSRAIVADLARRDVRLQLLDNPARIQSAGINAAVRRWGKDCAWLVRIDAHCIYPDGYIRGLVAAARANDAGSVVVPMRTVGHSCFQRAVAAAQNSVLGTGGSPHRHIGSGKFVDHGHHALMRIDRFCAVGGYDEGFAHNEDAELDQRLLAAGGTIWLEPALSIAYFPRRTVMALFRQYRGYGIGRALTSRRHRNPTRLRQALPLAVAPAALLALAGLLLMPVEPVSALLAVPTFAWAALCVVFGSILAVRQRSFCALASGVAAMAMHLGWSIGNWQVRASRRKPGAPPTPIVPIPIDPQARS